MDEVQSAWTKDTKLYAKLTNNRIMRITPKTSMDDIEEFAHTAPPTPTYSSTRFLRGNRRPFRRGRGRGRLSLSARGGIATGTMVWNSTPRRAHSAENISQMF